MTGTTSGKTLPVCVQPPPSIPRGVSSLLARAKQGCLNDRERRKNENERIKQREGGKGELGRRERGRERNETTRRGRESETIADKNFRCFAADAIADKSSSLLALSVSTS